MKLALNSQLPTVQILTNDVKVLILCLSYFVTPVFDNLRKASRTSLTDKPNLSFRLMHSEKQD